MDGAFLASLCLLSPAAAQDFGQAWLDEATQRLEEDSAPLGVQTVDLKVFAGERVAWDSNVHLSGENERSDTVFVTYGRAKMAYAERMFDAEADLQVNYNRYVHEDDASDHEERFFGRGRFQGAAFTGELAVIVRRESDPFTDPEVVERVERIVANAFPRAAVRLSGVLSVEAEANAQFVWFEEDLFESLDNQNVRGALTLVGSAAPWIDLMAQGGYQGIRYEEPGGPPNARGFTARLGARGDLSEAWRFDLWAGVARLESGDFPGAEDGAEHTTADIDAHLRYEATEDLAFLGDYVRRFGFSAGGSPFQVTDRVTWRGEYEAMVDVVLRARAQYDYVHGALGDNRNFWGVSGEVEWRIQQYVLLSGGVAYRAGGADPETGTEGEFKDTIVSAGAALTF